MEFQIALTAASPAPEVVQNAMYAVDSSALVDLDMSGLITRISSWVPVSDLITVLQRTGCWIVKSEQIAQLPSICCGGCSG